MTVALDRAQFDHIRRAGKWLTPEMCFCRTDENGRVYFTCHRRACGGRAQGCGGYCKECFPRVLAKSGLHPEVVVLCGSTRFSEAFREANLRLTLAGKVVLTVGCDTKSDADLGIAHEAADGSPTELKAALDQLHLAKIDMAHRVLVLNVGGYIGESTRREIEYAEWFETPIDYLEPIEREEAA